MNKSYNYQTESQECPCPCHCHYHCHCQTINPEINNRSEIITDIYNTQNLNSAFFSSNCNNSPLFTPKEIFNNTYSPKLNYRSNIKKKILGERPQSVKDKINSKCFIKNINNYEKNWNKPFNSNLNKFQGNKNPLNQSMSYLKNKINNINNENKYLTELLSKVPRHEKNLYGNRNYMDKLKLSFTNGNSGKRPKVLNSSLYCKKYQGHSSMIMPPNDLDSVIIKSNTYI